MGRRVADLVVYMIIIFPLNLIEVAVHVAFNAPLFIVAHPWHCPCLLPASSSFLPVGYIG